MSLHAILEEFESDLFNASKLGYTSMDLQYEAEDEARKKAIQSILALLPEEKERDFKDMGDGDDIWKAGYNSYRQSLLKILTDKN